MELLIDLAGDWPAVLMMASAVASTLALVFVAATLTNRGRHRQLRRVAVVRSRFTPGMIAPTQINSLRRNESHSLMDGLVSDICRVRMPWPSGFSGPVSILRSGTTRLSALRSVA